MTDATTLENPVEEQADQTAKNTNPSVEMSGAEEAEYSADKLKKAERKAIKDAEKTAQEELAEVELKEKDEKDRLKAEQEEAERIHHAQKVAAMRAMHETMGLPEPSEKTMSLFAGVTAQGKDMVMFLNDKSGALIQRGNKIRFEGENFGDAAAEAMASKILDSGSDSFKLKGGTKIQKNMIAAQVIKLGPLPAVAQKIVNEANAMREALGENTTEEQMQAMQERIEAMKQSELKAVISAANEKIGGHNLTKPDNEAYLVKVLGTDLDVAMRKMKPQAPSVEVDGNKPDAPEAKSKNDDILDLKEEDIIRQNDGSESLLRTEKAISNKLAEGEPPLDTIVAGNKLLEEAHKIASNSDTTSEEANRKMEAIAKNAETLENGNQEDVKMVVKTVLGHTSPDTGKSKKPGTYGYAQPVKVTNRPKQ